MTVTGQSTVTYTYDAADRLTAIAQSTATVAFGYDMANRRTSLTLPNGIVVASTYDAASRVTGLTYTSGGTTLGTLTYTYDAEGHRTSVGGTWARTGLPATLSSATYDATNQITQWAGTSFSYDGNGNLTSDGARTQSWNARNELTGLSGAVAASFGYDGLGRRRTKTVGGTSTQGLYDGVDLVQELSGGAVVANVLGGLGVDEPFTRTEAGGVRHDLADGLGSSVALADGSASVLTQYTYEPFGGTSASGSASGNVQQFTGRENDGTGLYFYRARYYDPRLQRFVSEDPIGAAGGLNVYGYAGDAPTDQGDPSGLKPSPTFGGPPEGQRPPGPPRPGGRGAGAGSHPRPDPNRPLKPTPRPCSGNSSGARVAYTALIIGDWGWGAGPALSGAYIPGTGEFFFGVGVGVSLGHNLSMGMVVGNNPSAVFAGARRYLINA